MLRVFKHVTYTRQWCKADCHFQWEQALDWDGEVARLIDPLKFAFVPMTVVKLTKAPGLQ